MELTQVSPSANDRRISIWRMIATRTMQLLYAKITRAVCNQSGGGRWEYLPPQVEPVFRLDKYYGDGQTILYAARVHQSQLSIQNDRLIGKSFSWEPSPTTGIFLWLARHICPLTVYPREKTQRNGIAVTLSLSLLRSLIIPLFWIQFRSGNLFATDKTGSGVFWSG